MPCLLPSYRAICTPERKKKYCYFLFFPPPFSFSFPTYPLLMCLSALPLIPFMFPPMPNKNGDLWLMISLFPPYWIISIIWCTKMTMRTEKICKIKSTCFLICSHLKTGVGWGGSKKSEPDKLCLLAKLLFCLLLHDKWLCCPELKAEYFPPFFYLVPI